jgi:adenylate cyclase
MGIEIERKFLLANADWRGAVTRSVTMRQGYLAGSDTCSIRIRVTADEARLNIKSATLGIERQEFDYAVPKTDAEHMLHTLCGTRTLIKTRHFVVYAGQEWEIDEFGGANAGLIVAELELAHRDQAFRRPPWLGREVSDDVRYYNSQLVEVPYATWARS